MEPLVKIASTTAHKAARFIEQAYDRADRLKIAEKGDSDYVTQVDQKAEQILISDILHFHPDHSVLAEESGLQGNPDSEYQWIIDPLDGTTNFIHGFPQFAISIAVRKQGRLEHALIYDPLRREEFHASRGRGAYLNNSRIRVSGIKTLQGSLLGTGFPFREGQMRHMDAYLEVFKKLATETAGIRRPGAASLDLAYVAAGRLDGFWEFGLQPWDMAAGALLIREAGGLVTDFTGNEQFLDKGHIVAANPKLLKALLQVVKPALGNL